MSRSRTSTYRRFEQRHPDLWDEVQAMIESDGTQSSEPVRARSIFARLFRARDAVRSPARRTRQERDE